MLYTRGWKVDGHNFLRERVGVGVISVPVQASSQWSVVSGQLIWRCGQPANSDTVS